MRKVGVECEWQERVMPFSGSEGSQAGLPTVPMAF